MYMFACSIKVREVKGGGRGEVLAAYRVAVVAELTRVVPRVHDELHQAAVVRQRTQNRIAGTPLSCVAQLQHQGMAGLTGSNLRRLSVEGGWYCGWKTSL